MHELVDVVDERDQIVGQATRTDMRRANLLHRAVYVVVHDPRGNVFVHQRTYSKDVYPGYWDVTIGGVVAAGETYLAAARRELREEIGACDTALEPLGPVRYEDAATRLIGFAFSTVYDGPLTLQADEVLSGRFVSRAEALRLIEQETCCPDGARVFRTYATGAARWARKQAGTTTDGS